MVARRAFRGLLLLCLGISLVGCAVSGLDSIQVSPASQALTVGQTTQLSVVGTYGNGNHLRTQPITNGLTWTSSNPSVTSVTSAGLVAAVGAGTSTVTASATAFNGVSRCGSTRRSCWRQRHLSCCDSGRAIGCRADSNQPVYCHRNDLIRGYG